MNKLLTLALLTGLVGCGAPQVDAPIDLDVQVGEDGKDGKDGVDALTNLYYNNVNLGIIKYIISDRAQITTSEGYRVDLSYSIENDEWSIPSSTTPNTVFYTSDDCSGDGIVTARIGRYGSHIRKMYLADGFVYTAMADLDNPYSGIDFPSINSYKLVGNTIGSCINSNIDTMRLLNDTVFKLNNTFVSGWNNNTNKMDAEYIEERL